MKFLVFYQGHMKGAGEIKKKLQFLERSTTSEGVVRFFDFFFDNG